MPPRLRKLYQRGGAAGRKEESHAKNKNGADADADAGWARMHITRISKWSTNTQQRNALELACIALAESEAGQQHSLAWPGLAWQSIS